jgi:hypothetical protein
MRIRCPFVFILVFSVLGCVQKKPDCHNISSGDVLSKYYNRVFIPKGGTKGNTIVQIIDKGIDSIKGGAYAFNNSSCLRKYVFFQNLHAYTYREDYNEKGEIIKTVGKVFVNDDIMAIHDDSVFAKIYLFGLKKNYQYLTMKINDGDEIKLDIGDDSLYTNMKIATFGINVDSLKKIVVCLSVRYKDERSLQVRNEYDTLSFVRNPKLSLDPSIKYPLPEIRD